MRVRVHTFNPLRRRRLEAGLISSVESEEGFLGIIRIWGKQEKSEMSHTDSQKIKNKERMWQLSKKCVVWSITSCSCVFAQSVNTSSQPGLWSVCGCVGWWANKSVTAWLMNTACCNRNTYKPHQLEASIKLRGHTHAQTHTWPGLLSWRVKRPLTSIELYFLCSSRRNPKRETLSWQQPSFLSFNCPPPPPPLKVLLPHVLPIYSPIVFTCLHRSSPDPSDKSDLF